MQKNLIVGQFLKLIDYHLTFRDIFENLSILKYAIKQMFVKENLRSSRFT